MRKLLLLAAVAVLGLFSLFGLFGVLLVSDAQAATSDNGYVIVRCTITVSVQVLSLDSTWYVNGNAANGPGTTCNQSYVSGLSSITVMNNSSGAITKWQVYVSTIQNLGVASDPKGTGWTGDNPTNGGWSLASASGLNAAALFAVFKTSATELMDFDTNKSSLTLVPSGSPDSTMYYQTVAGGGKFAPLVAAGNEFPSAILAGGYNWTTPIVGGATSVAKSMGFRLDTPKAVTDQNWRRFTLTVVASTLP